MKKYALILVTCLSVQIAFGQNKNLKQLGHLAYTNTTLHGSLNDIWGHVDSLGNEYAIVGLQKGVSIVDVTDPSNLIEVFYVAGPSSIWRDIKTWDNHAYITNESSGGMMIIDMSNLPGAISTSDVYYHSGSTYPFSRAHNLFIDEGGVAYIFGSSYGKKGAIFLDLNTNPKVPVEVGAFDSLYLHDGMVRGDTLWGAAVYTGAFLAVNVSNKSNPIIMASHFTSGYFAHNCWISNDGNTLFTTDEISSGAVGAYDVSNLSNIDEVDLIWSNPGSGVIPHNTHVNGDFLVTSYYRDGVTVVDASRPDRMVQVGNYDTSPSLSGNGFNGAWGAYPFLPSGNILVSDIENGLFVLGVDYIKGVYLQGNTRKFSDSSAISATRIKVLNTGDSIFSNLLGFYKESYADSGLYRLAFSKNGYLPDTLDIFMHSGQLHYGDVYLRRNKPFKVVGTVLSAIKGDSADVLLEGKYFSYRTKTDTNGYFEIDSVYEGAYEFSAGKWYTKTNCTSVLITQNDSLSIGIGNNLYDDFTFDNGWTTINNGSNGFWERENLNKLNFSQTLDYPIEDKSTDCSNYAFVTGSSTSGDHDVDGGWNWLVSPELILSRKPVLAFSYWFRNDAPTGSEDTLCFYTEINGDTFLLLKVHNGNNLYQSKWIDTNFNLFDLGLNLSSQYRFRLMAKVGDFGVDNLLEAGLDLMYLYNSTVGINEENAKQEGFDVYPNPFSNEFNFKLPIGSRPDYFELSDVTGRRLHFGQIRNDVNKIEIPPFIPSGMMLLKIVDKQGVSRTVRVVKQ